MATETPTPADQSGEYLHEAHVIIAMAKVIGVHQVPVDEVASVLAAIADVPTERRMDAVSTALGCWMAVEYQGGTTPRDPSEWRPR